MRCTILLNFCKILVRIRIIVHHLWCNLELFKSNLNCQRDYVNTKPSSDLRKMTYDNKKTTNMGVVILTSVAVLFIAAATGSP